MEEAAISRRALLAAGLAAPLLARPLLAAPAAPPARPLKIVSLLARTPDLTHEAFVRHWIDVHATMARAVPGVQGFIGSEPVDAETAGSGPNPADGMASIWYADRAGVTETVGSDAGKRWLADGNTFIDRGRSRNYFTREHVIVPGARVDGGLKRTMLLVRRPGTTHAQFMAHWLSTHAALARAVPGILGCVFTEIDSVAGGAPGTEPDLDGIAESWWDGPGTEAGGKRASPQVDAWAADASTFEDPARSRLLISRERIVIPPPAG